MQIKKLFVAGLRNFKSIAIEPGNNFNLIYGLNGQGKTNLLEAIFLLGSPRSFRNCKQHELIRHDEKKAVVKGEVESNRVISDIMLTLEQAGRRVEINGKGIARASELHGKLNSVVFSPDDTGMVRNGPDLRRRYLDRAVYMVDIQYLHCWHDYHRILKQRNNLLKKIDTMGLDIWTDQLATVGAEVIERRHCFVSILNERLKRHYTYISGGSETAEITYRPEGIKATNNRPAIRIELLDLLNRNAKNDERYGTTTSGPHRDDLVFTLNGKLLKSFGSQGQQKSFVLALKMAEIEYLEEIFSESPILLLDDMSSELDSERSRNLLNCLSTKNIQVFITTTERSPALLDSAAQNCFVFHVQDGNLTFEENKKYE
jgi:DNA replication and repair protein RecF